MTIKLLLFSKEYSGIMEMTQKILSLIYHRLKRLAEITLAARFYTSCISYIKAASWMAYSFNISFRDDELEDLTFRLSKNIKKKHCETNADSVVLIDSFAHDNHGLAQQYIRAIMAQQRHLLYITDASPNSENAVGLYGDLNNYPCATIVHVPNRNKLAGLKRAQFIYNEIIKAHPYKVFMHLTPNAAEVIIAMHALSDKIIKYQINLTDHTFWLGATACDYSLEFRPYGFSVSEQARKIDRSKLLLCPYYPIVDDIPFKGFPFEKKNECVIFSGGSSYKFGDDKNTFFVMMKRLLDENPSLIWVHAGDNMDGIKEKMMSVMSVQYLRRIYLVGIRNDIAEVFRHIDIYINSYPFGGGLMNLYAAHFSKPVVSLKRDVYTSANEILGQLKDVSVDFTTIDDLCVEVHRLVECADYRIQRGKQLQDSVIKVNQFNELFDKLCTSNTNILPIPDKSREVHLPSSGELYDCRSSIVKIIKWRGLFVPYCQKEALLYYPSKMISVIKRYFRK